MKEGFSPQESPNKKPKVTPGRQALFAAVAAFSTAGDAPPTLAQDSAGGKGGDKTLSKVVEQSHSNEQKLTKAESLIKRVEDATSAEDLWVMLGSISSLQEKGISWQEKSELLIAVLEKKIGNSNPHVIKHVVRHLMDFTSLGNYRSEVMEKLVNTKLTLESVEIHKGVDDRERKKIIRKVHQDLGLYRENLRGIVGLISTIALRDPDQALGYIKDLQKQVSDYQLVPILYEVTKEDATLGPLTESALREPQEKQSVEQIADKFEKSFGTVDSFFTSAYWLNLQPSEREAFIRANIIDAAEDEIKAHNVFYNSFVVRSMLLYENEELYKEYMQRFAEKNPNTLLRSFCDQDDGCGQRIFWEVDRPYIEAAIKDKRTHPSSRISFYQYTLNLPSEHAEKIDTKELFGLLPAPEVLVMSRNYDPKTGKLLLPHEETDFDSIYDDPALKRHQEVSAHFPAEFHKGIPSVRAKWIVMVTRNLHFGGHTEKITAEVVEQQIERIEQARKYYEHYQIFGEDSLLVGHEELKKDGKPRFATPTFVAKVKNILKKEPTLITPHTNWHKGQYTVTPETLRKARERVLAHVQEGRVLPSSHFTAFFDGHGGGAKGGAFYLSDGRVVRGKVTETLKTTKINATELVAALDKRYEDPELRKQALERPPVIIVGTCSSSNIVRTVLGELEKRGLPLPIVLAASEYNQYGYSDYSIPVGSDFNRGTILGGESGGKTPTIGGAVFYERYQDDSSPVIMVPDPENKSRPMQIGTNEHLPYEIKTSIG